MIEKNHRLEQEVFKKFIQSEIKICALDSFNNKTVLKSGKLINFNIKLPFLYFLIESKTKSKEFVLPQPFRFNLSGEDKVILSYRLKDSIMDEKIVDEMKKMGMMSESKIYNKLIHIETS
jgi:hypothetical protein